jgi:stage II sporulation protein D
MPVFPLICLLVAPQTPHVDTVRIGLASLFKPKEIRVSVVDGSDAFLEVGGTRVPLRPGEETRIALDPGGRQLTANSPAGEKTSFSGSGVRLISPGSAIELVLPGKLLRRVRGKLFISPARSRRSLQIVVQVDLESAVRSVVAAELAGNRNAEALQAMAVVARTYMLAHLGRHAGDGFDFCDTTHCQFYRGEDDWMEGVPPSFIAAAVSATRGQWVSYRGSLVETYYTAACGGLTQTPRSVWGGQPRGGYRYTRVACAWCRESPYWRWERAADAGLVFDALAGAAGFRLSDRAELIARTTRSSPLVRAVVVRDGSRSTTLSVEAFRRALGQRLGWNTVRSPSFVIERLGSRFVFKGRGFGSQVGLCVAGAMAQAAAGRTHSEILSYYFPGTKIGGRP